jgi:hypothetical protein
MKRIVERMSNESSVTRSETRRNRNGDADREAIGREHRELMVK